MGHVTDMFGSPNSTGQQDVEVLRRHTIIVVTGLGMLHVAFPRRGRIRLLHAGRHLLACSISGSQWHRCGSAGASISSAGTQALFGRAPPLAQTFVSRIAQGGKTVHHITDNVTAAAHRHAFEGVAQPVAVRVILSAIEDTSLRRTRAMRTGSAQALG